MERAVKDAFAIGNKQPLPPSMRKDLVRHLPYLAGTDLDAFTFERRRSLFPDAKADIFVFDGEGRPVIEGREFYTGPAAFWPRRWS